MGFRTVPKITKLGLSQDSQAGDLAPAATGRSRFRASISGELLEGRDDDLLLSPMAPTS